MGKHYCQPRELSGPAGPEPPANRALTPTEAEALYRIGQDPKWLSGQWFRAYEALPFGRGQMGLVKCITELGIEGVYLVRDQGTQRYQMTPRGAARWYELDAVRRQREAS